MKIGIIRKLQNHLFLKISLIFGLGLFIIVSAVFVAHGFIFLSKRFNQMRQRTIDHAQYIVKDIKKSMDFEKAGEIAGRNNIKIRIQTPTNQWVSHEGMIKFSDIDLPVYNKEQGIWAGFTEVGFCIIFQSEGNRYLVIPHSKREGFEYATGLFLLVIITCATALLISMYFIMQWQLRPIKVLSEGVKQLSEGNIDYQMTTNRSDELGKLVQSFNQMTHRIGEMIHARQQLLLDVSHELRSPLTRIKVALEFLEDNNTKSTISEDVSEVETMINELLETERLDSRYGALKPKKSKIKTLIDEVCEDFGDRQPGIKLISFPEDINLDVDPDRIKILFRNVLDNALRYSRDGGYPVELSLREKTGETIIAVQDFGHGIPEKDLPFIFEPFYRVDKSRSKETGGYGLGMSLCKKIMEAHDGSIEIISKLNIGTTVFIKFKK